MGLNSIPSFPVTSQNVLDDVSAELRKAQESYYIIFHIILSSGMPLNRVVQLKVKDLYLKPYITYLSRHNTTTFKISIPLKLQRDIKNYLKGKPSDSFAFIGIRSDKPLLPTAFQKALQVTSERLKVSPAITSTSLRKTFIYNTIVADGDYKRAMKYLCALSKNQVHDYLGVDFPKTLTNKEASTAFVKSIQRDAIGRSKNKILKALDDAAHLAEHPEDRTIDNMKKTVDLLNALSDIIYKLDL